jgi:AAA domain/MarR family
MSEPTARPRPRNGAHPEWPPFVASDAEAPDPARDTWQPTPEELAMALEQAERIFPEPEDRGTATLSPLGGVEYVEDLFRPGRIAVMAAEEGTAKTHAANELEIRLTVAGGSFAGTWPVLGHGPVLILSEQHSDDDYEVEQKVLSALAIDREALTGRLFRLSLMTAAGGMPAVDDDAWRAWITEWMRDHGILLVIFDTASGATAVDPWGEPIRALFRHLRLMLADLPQLAIVLCVHLKKPQGRGARRISDVLGEFARWADVLLLMEADGLTRVRLTSRKRVRHQRQVIVTKAGGLLVDPVDADTAAGPKVPLEDVVAAIEAAPGLTAAELGAAIGVTKRTAQNYAEAAEAAGLIERRKGGHRGAIALFPADRPGNRERAGNEAAFPVHAQLSLSDRETGNPGIEDSRSPLRSGATTIEEDEDELLAQVRGDA